MSDQTQIETVDTGGDYYLCPDTIPIFTVVATSGKNFTISREDGRWCVSVYRKGRDNHSDWREGYYYGHATALQWAIADAMGHVAPDDTDREIAMYVLTLKAQ